MAKNLNYYEMANSIIKGLGGEENLSNVNHCATRLRVVVVDQGKVDASVLKSVKGVLGVEVKNDQVQVIVGQIIEDLYIEVERGLGKKSKHSTSSHSEKKSIFNKFTDFLQLMAGIMSPVIPSLIAAGFLTCLLLLMSLVFGVDTSNSTYILLDNLAQSVFYFLPIFVAYTSAKKFDTEPVLAMLLAGWLLYPGWIEMASEGGFTSYFGIPALLTTYNGAVLQIILSVWVMSKFDQMLKKYLPLSVRHFLKPFLLILLTSIVTLTLTGPLGGLLTNYIASGINWIRTYASWATVPAIIIFSTTVGILVPGFHLALIPIATTSLATVGYDDVINIWFFCATLTSGFIALAVSLKTKNRNLKEIGYPAALSALFGGISEPTTYGITYKMPKVYLSSTITTLIAGFYAGVVGLKSYGFGGYSLTNILLYYGVEGDLSNLIKAIIGVVIMAVSSFILINLFNWDDTSYNEDNENIELSELKNTKLIAPAVGTYIDQKDIKDSVFSGGLLGVGFGIKPLSNDIVAPTSGTINSIAPTKHAITIVSDTGAEVMVHIGIDTSQLNENEIQNFVQVGQGVEEGQKIAEIDLELFRKNNVDDTVIVLLMNSSKYSNVVLDSDYQTVSAVI